MDLLNQLEENINTTLEGYELLQLEVEELKEELQRLEADNANLLDTQTHWEAKVKSILSVFSDGQSEPEEEADEASEEGFEEAASS